MEFHTPSFLRRWKTAAMIWMPINQYRALTTNEWIAVRKLINKPFVETTTQDFISVYSVNVFGLAELVRLLLPSFSTTSHIINISSIGGIAGSSKFSGLSAYSSSKAALNVLTEMLYEEFKTSGPIINTLALGAVQTEMLEAAFPGYKAPLSSFEMANYIYDFSIKGHKYYNGKILPVSISNP